MAATKSYTYNGNPGYAYPFPDAGTVVLNPGDKVDLTADERQSVGDEFSPAAPKAKDDKTTTAPEGADTEEP